MKRELKFITICPTDFYFSWQVNLWLESLKDLGLSDKATILLFNPKGRRENPIWEKVASLYPESEFITYEDEDGTVSPFLGMYIPILRLYTMRRYCEAHPEIVNKAVFYCDSDIIFMKGFDISHLLDDEINYLSDTNSYINASYFDSKIRDVIPAKLEDYKKIDVLEEASNILGINREICEANNLHSGGTQYLLKNTDAKFWQDCFDKCIPLLSYLKGINKEYFPSENAGIQSWTADMWLVLWNIWARGGETKIVKEMDFAWSTDPLSRLETHTILHNAGVTGTFMNEVPMFYKGKYHQGTSPFTDPHLQAVLDNEKTQKTCNWYYANKLLELKNKYYNN